MIHADDGGPSCGCKQALEFALITAPDARDPKLVKKLDAVAGRLVNS